MTDDEKIIQIFKNGLSKIEKSELINLLSLLKNERLSDDSLRIILIYDIVEELIKQSKHEVFLKEQSNTGVTWEDFNKKE